MGIEDPNCFLMYSHMGWVTWACAGNEVHSDDKAEGKGYPVSAVDACGHVGHCFVSSVAGTCPSSPVWCHNCRERQEKSVPMSYFASL